MSAPVIVLEQFTKVAPFGVRFWDVAVDAPAGAGLTMVAYPDAISGLRSTAFANHSGVYSFRGLPGLSRAEAGAGDNAFWAANPPIIPYTIEVSDLQARYLPFRFSVLLPTRGLYGLVASPLFPVHVPDATWLPVFSTPSRELPGPAAIIHAQLQDDQAKLPAAWAMLTVSFQGTPIMTGLADARGMISLTVPYPEPLNPPFTSPMGPGAIQLTKQSWPIEIAAFYRPQSQQTDFPNLEKILQQSTATVWKDASHSAPASGFTLEFGRDLVLRSLESTNGPSLPVLLLTATGSPL